MQAEFSWSPFRPARYAAALAIGLLVLSGCTQTAAPAPADETQARKTLEQALAAWQQGQTVEAMKQANPPIHVSDPSWKKGDSLKRYEVSGSGKPSGAEREFTVTLWLANAAGKEHKTEVAYKVGTSPIHTVFRSMF